MSEICLVLTAATVVENLEIAKRNHSLIDILELRTDLLDEDQYQLLADFPSLIDKPVILTCRKVVDGGLWNKDEKQRREYLLNWMEGDYSYIDLEMDLKNDSAVVEKALSRGITIIRSFHDFNTVPADLYEKMISFADDQKTIVKGAVYPQTSEELFRLIDTALKLKKSDKIDSFILLGMGEFGFPTRILSEKLGSYLTFCSDSHESRGAPGHCSASDLNNIYNFRNITSSTVINSIIGNPVSQSKSPQIHNLGYKKKSIDAVYVPFLTDSPRWFMEIARLLEIHGSSVTVPFKSEIIPLVDHIDKSVNQIGASNTIYRDRHGRWLATNTDAYGLIKPLLDFIGVKDLDSRKVAVIGAGGAARAAVFALLDMGAQVAIFNRTHPKGLELADLFSCRAYPLEESSIEELKEYSSIIVQTTNVGMAPLEHIDPLDFYSFSGDELVYDIIYKPEETLLMKKAAEAGCPVLGGFKMLEEQAYLQFKLFTGIDYN